MTLSRRNGSSHFDQSAFWWDDLPVNGIVTSFVRLDILSKYSDANVDERRILELEIYGDGEYGATRYE